MSTADFDDAIEHYHLAQGEFLKGNPEPVKELWSHRADVSLANPYGPPVRGWEQVAQMIEHAASLRRDGDLVGIETIAQYVTADLGYVVAIERATAKIGSREDITPYALRATDIFRREEGAGRWCIATPTPSPRRSQRNRSSTSSTDCKLSLGGHPQALVQCSVRCLRWPHVSVSFVQVPRCVPCPCVPI